MAPFTNSTGETSPDEIFVNLIVRPGPDKDHRTLVRVDSGNSKQGGVPLKPEEFAQKAATIGAQGLNFANPIVTSRSLDAKVFDSITKSSHSILLMDVGRWGGPAPTGKPLGVRQRDFGVVAGTRAALCEFQPVGTTIPAAEFLILDPAGKPIDHPINTFLTEMRKAGGSVRIMRHDNSTNPNSLGKWVQDTTTVHVILPDLHLPICTSKPAKTTDDGHHMGRFEYQKGVVGVVEKVPDDHGMVKPIFGSGPAELGSGALRWFDRYLAGDIFGHADESAAVDLIKFLDVIEAIKLPAPLSLHFTQLGDLYDLWIGLDRFFSEQPTHSVVLQNNGGILAGDFIDHWCRRTEAALMPASGDPRKNVVSRLNALSLGSAIRSSWLHGNHDAYLAAHTAQKVGGGNMFAPRKPLVSEGGTRIEHGQRGDPQNRDGATSGHSGTNQVFAFPVIRSFDPNRRNFYFALAAVTYAEVPDFHIFVMGHTHSPFLTRMKLRMLELPL
ncbi:MAG: hypothetical protein IT352_11960 [Gemmatimonadales bacterium]|nr:hypothetical protein [Gemmatimonadales bacterium]